MLLSYAHARLVVGIAVMFVIMLQQQAHGAPNHGAARLDRVWKNKRQECERGELCGGMLIDEAQNCINACISASCFKEVYGEMPLEDGEIDNARSRQFTNCLRKESRDEKLAALKEKNQQVKQQQQQQQQQVVGLD